VSTVHNINSTSKRLFTTQRSRSDTTFTLDDWAGVLYDQTQDAVAFNYAESVTGAVYMPEADLNSPERKPPLLHSVPAAVVCDGAAVLRLLHIYIYCGEGLFFIDIERIFSDMAFKAKNL